MTLKIEATEKTDGASPKTFTWQAIANNEEIGASTEPIDIDNNEPVSFDVTFNADGNDQVVTIKLIDDEDQTVTFAFTITTGGDDTPDDEGTALTENTGVTLGGLSHATLGSAYSVAGNSIMLSAAANSSSATVDFIYYYGNTNGATIAAPNDETVNGTGAGSFDYTSAFTTQNATKFAKLSGTTYASITTDTELAAIGTSASATKATQLASGDVVLFETAGGNSGIFTVTAQTGDNAGTITLSVKHD